MKRSTLRRITARLCDDCVQNPIRPSFARARYVWPEALAADRPSVTGDFPRPMGAARRVTPTPPGPTLATGGWSPWSRAAGVEFRYRRGLDAQQARGARSVDALFQVRRVQTRGGPRVTGRKACAALVALTITRGG